MINSIAWKEVDLIHSSHTQQAQEGAGREHLRESKAVGSTYVAHQEPEACLVDVSPD